MLKMKGQYIAPLDPSDFEWGIRLGFQITMLARPETKRALKFTIKRKMVNLGVMD